MTARLPKGSRVLPGVWHARAKRPPFEKIFVPTLSPFLVFYGALPMLDRLPWNRFAIMQPRPGEICLCAGTITSLEQKDRCTRRFFVAIFDPTEAEPARFVPTIAMIPDARIVHIERWLPIRTASNSTAMSGEQPPAQLATNAGHRQEIEL